MHDAAPGGPPTVQQPLQSSQPVSPRRPPSMTAHFRTAPAGTSFSQKVTSSYSPNFDEPSQCIVSRSATVWAESLNGAISGHQSWALLCRHRCRLLLGKVPKFTDTVTELKLRLRMWEAGQVSELTSKEIWGSNTPVRFATSGATADARTARESSFVREVETS